MESHTDIDLTNELKIWLETKSDQLPLSLMELSNQYQKYVDDTFVGKRGKTAQLWKTYLLHNYCLFLINSSLCQNK